VQLQVDNFGFGGCAAHTTAVACQICSADGAKVSVFYCVLGCAFFLDNSRTHSVVFLYTFHLASRWYYWRWLTVKKLEDYMNDASVINEPMPIREIHAIRLMIYDEIKEMSPKEINEYYMKNFEKVQKEYNFKVLS